MGEEFNDAWVQIDGSARVLDLDDAVVVERADGTRERIDGLDLDAGRSREVFARAGTITRVRWIVGEGTIATWQRRAAPEPSTTLGV